MFPTENKATEGGINIENWDQPIYRIFPKDRFIDILENKKNGLVRPKLWDDPMENFFLNSVVKTKQGELGSLESIKSSWYGQCWTAKSESDAMWRIYSPDKQGIKVKTTVNKLFETIYRNNDPFSNLKYFIGKVKYETREEIENFLTSTSFRDLAIGGQSRNFARTLCIKRPEFEHEDEIRILFYDSEKENEQHDYVLFDFDFNYVIDEVVIDPRVSESEYSLLEKEIKSSGYKSNISQSQLYKISPSIIQL